MSNFRVGAFRLAVLAVVITGSGLRAADSPPVGIYRLDEKTNFNVLDAVIQDAISGQITLVGHRDSRFGDVKIPYLQHLAVLLESPAPEFSLEWTSASKVQVEAMFRRLDDRQEMARIAFGWGKLFDSNGEPTAAGRYFLPALGIEPPNGSWKGVDQFGRIAAIYRAAGNDAAAEATELYGKLQGAINKSAAAHGGTAESSDFVPILMEFIGVAGKMHEVEEVRERVRRGEMSRAEQLDAAFRILADSLDSGLGLSGSPAAAAYSRARASGLPPSKAYDQAVVSEVNDQLQKIGHDILEKLFDRAGEVQVPPEVLAESTGAARPEVIPTYYGISAHSQLARLFFEADYLGKSLMNKPELSRTIPGYQTEFSYERSHPVISAERAKRTGPDRIPGLVFVAWSPHPPQVGAPAISAIAEGGVSFKLTPTAAVPNKGTVDAVALENCPDVSPPSGGGPVGWTTGGSSGEFQGLFTLTISTKTMANDSDGQFLTPSPKGYNVLWSPTATNTQWRSATCQQESENVPLPRLTSRRHSTRMY